MSERRVRCEELADMIMDAVERYGNSDLLQKNAVAELEAFAKAERVTGMEAARRFVAEQGHHAPGTILARLDAEIKQLKEGG